MKNREKYRNLIMSGKCDCDFVHEHILGYVCYERRSIGCNACRMMQTLWLDEEAKEEEEVDWGKIAVDTPVLVSTDQITWLRRSFAFSINNEVWAFGNGATSKTAGSASKWEYAKLMDPASITS